MALPGGPGPGAAALDGVALGTGRGAGPGRQGGLGADGGAEPGAGLIEAVAHGSGLTVGQTASDSASGEILGARRLLREIPAAGRVMTLDALRSCPETAHLITELGADCAMPVKDSRPTLLEDIRLLDWDSAAEFKTPEKGRGRVETRRCRAIALDSFPDELAALPGHRQVFCIVR